MTNGRKKNYFGKSHCGTVGGDEKKRKEKRLMGNQCERVDMVSYARYTTYCTVQYVLLYVHIISIKGYSVINTPYCMYSTVHCVPLFKWQLIVLHFFPSHFTAICDACTGLKTGHKNDINIQFFSHYNNEVRTIWDETCSKRICQLWFEHMFYL